MARNPARLECPNFSFCGPNPLETLFKNMFRTKFAHYAVHLPCDTWLPRLLHWKVIGQPCVGRPCRQVDDMLRMFCRYKRLGEWEIAARHACNWEPLMLHFINFCIGS